MNRTRPIGNSMWIRLVICQVAIAMVLAACGATEPESSPGDGDGEEPQVTATPSEQSPKEITVLQSAEITTFDPSMVFGSHEMNVQTQVYEALGVIDPELNQLPWLATSWEPLTDTTWQVTLREGVTFHNGETMTAEDVLASYEYLTREDAAVRSNFQNWASVEAVDDYELTVTTNTPDTAFFGALIWLRVMPASVLASDPDSLASEPIGTGPYMLAEWVPEERVVLEANPDYWNGEPAITQVTWRGVPETSARVAALLAGQADLIVNVPPESIASVEDTEGLRIDSQTSLRNITVIFDSRQPPFDDPRVRQAMNYAIDKESIVNNILGGRAEIQTSTSRPGTPNHNPNLEAYPYDPERARELLAEAGYPDGFEVVFNHPTGRWIRDVEVAQAIAGMLEEVGVRTELRTGEYTAFFQDWADGKNDGMTMIGTLNQYDAYQVFQLFLYSDGRWGVYTNEDATIDELYEAQTVELDPDARQQIIWDLEEYVHDQAYWLYLYFQGDVFGASEQLDWRPPANEIIWLWDADLND